MKTGHQIFFKRLLKALADNFAASAMVLLVVLIFILFPLSFSRFNTVQTMREQYNLMDTYLTISNRIGQKKPYRYTRNDIVIVDIKDVYDRDSLASLLETIVSAGPKAIGLDVFFSARKSEVADRKIAEIASMPNVISPIMLQGGVYGEEHSFLQAQTSFYMDCLWENSGFINLASSGSNRTCRVFAKNLDLAGSQVDNFDMALLKIVSEDAYNRAVSRPDEAEHINYSLSSYSTFSAESVPYNLDMLKDKVVIVGDREDVSDRHVTPVDARMPGVDIHAMTLATMMDGRYIHIMSEFGAWIMAFIAIFFFLPLLKLAKRHEWASIFCPVFQTILIVAAIFVCYFIFVNHGYYVRVVYALLGIGFIDFGNNIYLKLKDLCVRLFSH